MNSQQSTGKEKGVNLAVSICASLKQCNRIMLPDGKGVGRMLRTPRLKRRVPICMAMEALRPCRGHMTLLATLCLLLAVTVMAQERVHTSPPLLYDRPFLVIWNIPSEQCKSRFSVDLDLSMFDMYSTPNEGFYGQNVTIFYPDRLGIYPYITDDGETIFGGLPQNTSITQHLDKALVDIEKYIPMDQTGRLAIIDWEMWRPQWLRNWDKKDVYRQRSRDLVRLKHPNWTDVMITQQAQWEFETAAQQFMVETLQLGKNLRPEVLWGFYLFPDCYNHDYKDSEDKYTGVCPDVELSRNNELDWLWNASTALFPSIYMPKALESTANGRKFVRYRVMEAMRVSTRPDPYNSLPIYVYSQLVYINSDNNSMVDYKSEVDLIQSIGESAAMGAAGVVLWGDKRYSQSKTRCTQLQEYITSTVGLYTVNVTAAATWCSRALCGSQGRCKRISNESDAYLHLNPNSFSIQRNRPPQKGFTVSGRMSRADVLKLQAGFMCQCYTGWKGRYCDEKGSYSSSPRLTAMPCALLGVIATFLVLALPAL
ncbi:hyaluronidase-2-like isoform X2 [Lampetra fluviatilis]